MSTIQSVAAGPRDTSRPPVHPGEIIAEDIIAEGRISAGALASALDVPADELAAVMAQKAPVTPRLAVRLGLVLGSGPLIWLRLQHRHDMWLAGQPFDTSRLTVLHNPLTT